VNLNRLTLGGRIVGIAGLVLFIDSFLPWFRACADFGAFGGRVCGSHSAWDNVLTLLATLLTLGLLVMVGLELAGTALPPLGNVTWKQVQLGAAAVILLFVVLQIIIGDDGAPRFVGAWIGLVAAAALAYGAFQRSREPEVQRIPPGPLAP
jgi:hypothetical protein